MWKLLIILEFSASFFELKWITLVTIYQTKKKKKKKPQKKKKKKKKTPKNTEIKRVTFNASFYFVVLPPFQRQLLSHQWLFLAHTSSSGIFNLRKHE